MVTFAGSTLAAALHEGVAAVALQVEQRRQVGMVDADRCARRDARLRPPLHAEAGAQQHRQVVGAVANRDRTGGRDAEPVRCLQQGLDLSILVEDGFADAPGPTAIRDPDRKSTSPNSSDY